MSVIVKPVAVYDFIKENEKCVFFKIKDTDGKSIININNRDITPNEAIERIERTLNDLSGEFCFIELYDRSDFEKATGGKLRAEFNAKVELPNKIISGGRSGIQNSQVDMFSMFMAQMESNRKLELELLQMKLTKETETGKNSALEVISEKILSDDKLKGSVVKLIESFTGRLINGGSTPAVGAPVVHNDTNEQIIKLRSLYPKIDQLLDLVIKYEQKEKGSIENLHNYLTGMFANG